MIKLKNVYRSGKEYEKNVELERMIYLNEPKLQNRTFGGQRKTLATRKTLEQICREAFE